MSEDENEFTWDGELKGMVEMMQAATVLHEMFESFKSVGFTEDQAMELLKAAMATKGQ